MDCASIFVPGDVCLARIRRVSHKICKESFKWSFSDSTIQSVVSFSLCLLRDTVNGTVETSGVHRIGEKTMRRKIIAAVLSVAIVFGLMPFVSAASDKLPELSRKSIYYTSDYRSGDCVLSSAKSMMRRAAIARGSHKWDTITNTSLRGKATIRGLFRNSFSFKNDGIKYSVITQDLLGTDENKLKDIRALLANHPEGIVVRGPRSTGRGPHAILVTGYKNGVLYAVDSTHNSRGVNEGIEAMSDTTVSTLTRCTDVWFFSKVRGGKNIKKATGPSTLCVTGVNRPEQLKRGRGFGVTGSVQSNYKIRTVTVSVINSSGKEVIIKSAKPGSKIYMLGGLDSLIKFGILPAGNYTYRIAASDEKKGNTVLHENKFVIESGWTAVRKAIVDARITKASNDGITATSVRVPVRIPHGKGFSIKGKIKSSAGITGIRVLVMTESGKTVLSASVKPDKNSYNISKLDRNIKFGKLGKGKYIYKVEAENGSGWHNLVSRQFTVS